MANLVFLTAKRIGAQVSDSTTPKIFKILDTDIKKVSSLDNGSLINLRGQIPSIKVYETPEQVGVAVDPSAARSIDKDLSITAAGSAQGAGFAITQYFNVVDTATDTTAEALDLPAATVGKVIVVVNDTAVALEVFPASSETINGAAADAVYDQAAKSTVHYYCDVAGAWKVLVA